MLRFAISVPNFCPVDVAPRNGSHIERIVEWARMAEMLDEGLQVITGLWTGEPFTFRGSHFQVEDVTYLPRPMRRAARWDGVLSLEG